MQRSDDQLEMAIDLYRSGCDLTTHELVAVANNMLALGYTKGIVSTLDAHYPPVVHPVIEELAPETAAMIHGNNGDVPDPDLDAAKHPSAVAKHRPHTSDRPVSPGGIQWNSEWVDPNNITPPKPGLERKWSGWQGMNENQLFVLKTLTGEKGRYTVGIQSVVNYIKKYGGDKVRREQRKHIKPHYLMHSLSRRGLIVEIDKDVWILAPRGRVFVREFLGLEPTPKHDSVEAVAS